MMRHQRTLGACVTVLGLLIPCAAAPADSKIDFSGTWEMDAGRSVSAQSGAPAVPVTLVIRQSPTELSIETRRGDHSETVIYRMDGSPTKIQSQRNGPFEWRAKWQESKLITEMHRNVNNRAVTIQETLNLDPKAKELTVVRLLTVQHGYNMEGAKNYSSGQDVFVKTR